HRRFRDSTGNARICCNFATRPIIRQVPSRIGMERSPIRHVGFLRSWARRLPVGVRACSWGRSGGDLMSIKHRLAILMCSACVSAALLPAGPAAADDAQTERLQRQIDAMQQQLLDLKRQMKQTKEAVSAAP